MDVYLVFNELCLLRPRPLEAEANEFVAQDWMRGFGDVITHARRYGIKVLRVRHGFFEMVLVPDYTLRDWATDKRIDRELKRRIQSAATAYDELEHEIPEDIQEAAMKKRGLEFRYDGSDAEGLGFAILLESIAVSLDTEECWRQSEIDVEVEEIIEVEGDIQIVPSVKVTRHASYPNHLDTHRDWLQLERFATSVQNGKDLLDRIEDWFPNLVVLDSAKDQVREMFAGTPQLRQFVNKLFELENYCQQWKTGGFDKNSLASKASPESASVRNDTHLRSFRIFRLPDGREEFFEWHLRLTPDEWRLFFLPDPANHKVYIGYVGRKLPTRKYRTM
jgi:hypothetical protein